MAGWAAWGITSDGSDIHCQRSFDGPKPPERAVQPPENKET